MLKLLSILVVIGIVGSGIYLYVTRPLSAPSTNMVATSTTAGEGEVVFRIVPERSMAQFEIDEVLNNAPKHVVGTTSAVSGEIRINSATPETSSVGTISINARTIKTDSDRRDGAIGRAVLKAETHEFITFEPIEISGLPDNPQINAPYDFKVRGTLTVAGVAKEAVFNVTAKANSENEIQGVAVSTINYKDWNITIPQVPFVASVEDEVKLTFSFVAVKQ
jgi:polyisoprenoid-binding protein YceI